MAPYASSALFAPLYLSSIYHGSPHGSTTVLERWVDSNGPSDEKCMRFSSPMGQTCFSVPSHSSSFHLPSSPSYQFSTLWAGSKHLTGRPGSDPLSWACAQGTAHVKGKSSSHLGTFFCHMGAFICILSRVV